MPKKVLLSVDTGIDDAIGLLIALKTLDVIGVTTTFGNTTVENATRNTLGVLHLAGADSVPVAQGAKRPLVGEPPPPSSIHGPRGLGDISLPISSKALCPLPAPLFIYEKLKTASTHITFISLGPLTNLALALKLFPSVACMIDEVVIMGGSTTYGNVSPVAEFNIYADPESAQIIFRSGCQIRICGLNVTRNVSLSASQLNMLSKSTSPVIQTVYKLLAYRKTKLKDLLGIESLSLHDPTAVLSCVEPEKFSFERLHVDVELRGQLTRGMIVYDIRPGTYSSEPSLFRPKHAPNAFVAMTADVDGLATSIVTILQSYE